MVNNILLAYLSIIVVTLVGFFIQIYARLYNRYFGIDTWILLNIADFIRKNKRLPKTMPEKYLIEGPFDYPPLFLWFLSLFRKKFLDKNQGLFSPVITCLHSLILFAFLFILTGNLIISLMAQLIFCLTPIIIIENSQLSARAFSQLIFTLTFLSILAYSQFSGWLLFLLCAVLTVILLLSHKLAVQALLFLLVAFSIWYHDISYLLILLVAIVLAVVLSKGYYLTILRGHLAILNFWRKNFKYRYAHQIRGNKKKKGEIPDPVSRIYSLAKKIPLAPAMGANPFMIFLLVGSIFIYKTSNFNQLAISSSLFLNLILWSLVLFSVAVLVGEIKFIGFLGEAERYLEYSAFPTAIASAVTLYYLLETEYGLFFVSAFFIISIVMVLLPILFIQRKLVIEDEERTITPDLWQTINYINGMKEEVRLATIPLYLISPISYFTNCKILSTESALALSRNLIDFYPVLRKPLRDIFKKYDISYLLINEHYVQLSEIDLIKKIVVKKIGKFSLIKVENSKKKKTN